MKLTKFILDFLSTLLTSWPFIVLILLITFRKTILNLSPTLNSTIKHLTNRVDELQIKNTKLKFSKQMNEFVGTLLKSKLSSKVLDDLTSSDPKLAIIESYETELDHYEELSKDIYGSRDKFNKDEPNDFFLQLLTDDYVKKEYYKALISLDALYNEVRNNELIYISETDALIFRSNIHDFRMASAQIAAEALRRRNESYHPIHNPIPSNRLK